MNSTAPAATTTAPAASGTASSAAPAAGAAAAAAASSSAPTASLYVGDLTNEVQERDLFDLFSVVGPIDSIRVLRDSVSRRSLGYAYVNFASPMDADRALDTLNYHSLKGRPVRIMWKQRDPSIRKSGVGNIFIKNLDRQVDSRTLNDTFSQFGNIMSCKVATDYDSQSKGYGFVQYETKEEADLAIEKVNGNLICGKPVYVAHFVPATERSTQRSLFSNVFVKNFDESIGDEQFRAAFEKYGEISSAVIMKDENDKSKGFGFVNFAEPEQAEKMVDECNNTAIFGDDKMVFCGRAEKKARRQAQLQKEYLKKKDENAKRFQGINLYVKYLDEEVDDARLTKEFSTFGTITSAKVMVDEKTGQTRGFGFVCFSTPEEATRAVTEMNGKILGTKPLFVALHQPRFIRQQELQRQNMQRQYGGMPGGPRFAPAGGIPYMAGTVPMMAAGGPQGPRPGPVFMFPSVPQGRWMQQRPPMAGPVQRQGPNRGGRNFPAGRQGAQGAPAPVPGSGAAPSAAGAAQARQQHGVQFKGTARNLSGPQGQAAPAAPGSAPAPAAQPMPQNTSLTQQLANATPEQQKQVMGEQLYVKIAPKEPVWAGKITGMLLEGLNTSELLHLVEDPEALDDKIQVAKEALARHNKDE